MTTFATFLWLLIVLFAAYAIWINLAPLVWALFTLAAAGLQLVRRYIWAVRKYGWRVAWHGFRIAQIECRWKREAQQRESRQTEA